MLVAPYITSRLGICDIILYKFGKAQRDPQHPVLRLRARQCALSDVRCSEGVAFCVYVAVISLGDAFDRVRQTSASCACGVFRVSSFSNLQLLFRDGACVLYMPRFRCSAKTFYALTNYE